MRSVTLLVPFLLLSGCFLKKDKEVEDLAQPEVTTDQSAGAPVELTEEPETPEEKATEAVDLLEEGSIESSKSAVRILKELESEFPDDPSVPFNLGLAQLAAGNQAQAESAFRRATQIDPELAAAWLELGRIAEEQGGLAAALNIYRQGIKAAPEDEDLRVAEVATLMRMDMLEEAIASAKATLEVNSNAINIYANLAQIYIRQGNLPLAKFLLQKAKAIPVMGDRPGADENTHVHTYLGRIAYLEGYPALAMAEYERALELDQENLYALIYLAEVHLDNRSYQEMVPLLEKAKVLAPEDVTIRMNLGIGYRGVGNYEQAGKEYEKVLELQPDAVEPYLNLIILHGDYLKDYKEALELVEKYKAAGGQEIELVDSWVEQYEKEKKRAERLEERKRRAEERARKRAEEEKFLEEFRKKQEEEARKAEESQSDGTESSQPGAAEDPGDSGAAEDPGEDPGAAEDPGDSGAAEDPGEDPGAAEGDPGAAEGDPGAENPGDAGDAEDPGAGAADPEPSEDAEGSAAPPEGPPSEESADSPWGAN